MSNQVLPVEEVKESGIFKEEKALIEGLPLVVKGLLRKQDEIVWSEYYSTEMLTDLAESAFIGVMEELRSREENTQACDILDSIWCLLSDVILRETGKGYQDGVKSGIFQEANLLLSVGYKAGYLQFRLE